MPVMSVFELRSGVCPLPLCSSWHVFLPSLTMDPRIRTFCWASSPVWSSWRSRWDTVCVMGKSRRFTASILIHSPATVNYGNVLLFIKSPLCFKVFVVPFKCNICSTWYTVYYFPVASPSINWNSLFGFLFGSVEALFKLNWIFKAAIWITFLISLCNFLLFWKTVETERVTQSRRPGCVCRPLISPRRYKMDS